MFKKIQSYFKKEDTTVKGVFPSYGNQKYIVVGFKDNTLLKLIPSLDKEGIRGLKAAFLYQGKNLTSLTITDFYDITSAYMSGFLGINGADQQQMARYIKAAEEKAQRAYIALETEDISGNLGDIHDFWEITKKGKSLRELLEIGQVRNLDNVLAHTNTFREISF